MKRRRLRGLPRILPNAATVPSLVLCLASAGLWVRSHRVTDIFRRYDYTADRQTREQRVMSRFGAVAWTEHGGYYSSHREGLAFGRWLYDRYAIDSGDVDRRRPAVFFLSRPTASQQAGFIYHRGPQDEASWNRPYPAPDVVIGLPYWATCVLTAVLPIARLAFVIRQWRARTRRAGDLCPTCAYDLRATPARSPECGAAPPAASQINKSLSN